MIEEVNRFLQNYFDVDKEQIQKLLSTNEAISFLIVWSIFEAKIFNGYCKNEKIKDFENSFSRYECKIRYLTLVNKFYERYKNKDKWNNLCYDRKVDYFDDLREQNISTYSDIEKIRFGLFIIFRYRNNIFHGNKKIDSWLSYKEQIIDCINMMLEVMNDKDLRLITSGYDFVDE